MRSDYAITILSVTIIILILIVGMIIVILLARRQQINQQLKEAQYQNKLNDIALASLRAQMNPHFIFNCLNSIKLYTEQNNSAAASEYLSKFSKLIRNMLDNARMEKTSLSSEIETLQLYLNMETMRFKDKMTYEVHMDPSLDADFIEVPPLLIQPYVENAIWHGIMHKDGAGKLTITVAEVQNNMLLITVEDNGVGRVKATQMKTDNSAHKSYGTQITSDRIALFNEKHKSDASVTITDLYDDDHNAVGTLVTLKIVIT
jgi:LytS/YehU family sensor histidine kinase